MKKVLSEKDLQTMLTIIRKALQNCHCTKTKARGRPHKYHHEIIILALLPKTHLKLTFRDLQAYMFKMLPKGSIPDLFLYLLQRLWCVNCKSLAAN